MSPFARKEPLTALLEAKIVSLGTDKCRIEDLASKYPILCSSLFTKSPDSTKKGFDQMLGSILYDIVFGVIGDMLSFKDSTEGCQLAIVRLSSRTLLFLFSFSYSYQLLYLFHKIYVELRCLCSEFKVSYAGYNFTTDALCFSDFGSRAEFRANSLCQPSADFIISDSLSPSSGQGQSIWCCSL